MFQAPFQTLGAHPGVVYIRLSFRHGQLSCGGGCYVADPTTSSTLVNNGSSAAWITGSSPTRYAPAAWVGYKRSSVNCSRFGRVALV